MGRQTYNRNPQIVSAGSVVNNITNNFNYDFEWGIFADGDATPSLSSQDDHVHFKTANTGATVITNFDDADASGMELTVLIMDVNTTIQNNANIGLQGGIDYGGPSVVGDNITFVYDPITTKWYETNRIAM